MLRRLFLSLTKKDIEPNPVYTYEYSQEFTYTEILNYD